MSRITCVLVIFLGMLLCELSCPVLSAWMYETVDSDAAGVSARTSIGVDAAGVIHIVYNTNTGWRYAWKTETGWHINTVDPDGSDPVMVLDDQSRPHVSYTRNVSQDAYAVYYAFFDGSDWQIEAINDPVITRFCTTIALDSDNYPHISYVGFEDSYIIRHTYKNSTGWIMEKAVSSNDYFHDYAEIAMDNDNQAHIIYSFPVENYILHHAYQIGSVWFTEALDDPAYRCSLLFDSSGTLHIAYSEYDQHDLMYAFKDTGGWHRTVIEAGNSTAAMLTLDSNNLPHLSYSTAFPWHLNYGYNDGTSWHLEPVDTALMDGYYSSIDIDSSGNPHIAYDDTDGLLKYATCSDVTIPALNWIGVTVLVAFASLLLMRK